MDASELPPPTSTADTRETEPEVVAGISSGEGNPSAPLAIRADDARFGLGAGLLVEIAGIGLGFAAPRMFRRS